MFGVRLGAIGLVVGAGIASLLSDDPSLAEPLALIGGSASDDLRAAPSPLLVAFATAHAENGSAAPRPLANSLATWRRRAVAAPSISRVEVLPDGAVRIAGIGTPGALVTLRRASEAQGSVTVSSGGDWQLTTSQPLAAGEHRFEAEATAAADDDTTVTGGDVRIAIPEGFRRDTIVAFEKSAEEIARERDAIAAERRRRAEELAAVASERFNELSREAEERQRRNGVRSSQAQPREPRATDGAAETGGRTGSGQAEGGLGASMDRALLWAQEWLERASREYQREIVRRLQVPAPAPDSAIASGDRPAPSASQPGKGAASKDTPTDGRDAAAEADRRRADAERKAAEEAKARAIAAEEEARRRAAEKVAAEKAAAEKAAAERAMADRIAAEKAAAERAGAERAAAAKQAAEKAAAEKAAAERAMAEKIAAEKAAADRLAAERVAVDKAAAEKAAAERAMAEKMAAEKAAAERAAAEAARQREAAAAELRARRPALDREDYDAREARLLEAELAAKRRRAAGAAERPRAVVVPDRVAKPASATEPRAVEAPAPVRRPPVLTERDTLRPPSSDAAGRFDGRDRREATSPVASARPRVVDRSDGSRADGRADGDVRSSSGDRVTASRDDGGDGTRVYADDGDANPNARCWRRAGRRIRPPGTYTVASGDSLWRISARHYRLGYLYPIIRRANPGRIADPNLIYPCQRLFLPRLRRR
jgi:nucleoid-associated protein YgaU